MKRIRFIVAAGIVCIAMMGCAYRYYLGMHGPSIQAFPEIHAGVQQDSECLACHDPNGDLVGPATSHPGFTGCLKCHNDPL